MNIKKILPLSKPLADRAMSDNKVTNTRGARGLCPMENGLRHSAEYFIESQSGDSAGKKREMNPSHFLKHTFNL